MQETEEIWAWSLGQEDSPEEDTAPHSSVLAWRIPRTEETGGLQSTGAQNWTRLKRFSTHLHTHALSGFRLKGNYGKLEKKWTNSLGAPGCYEPMSFLVFFYFFGIVYTDSCKMSMSNTGNSFILSFNRGAIFTEGCWLFSLKVFSPKLSF